MRLKRETGFSSGSGSRAFGGRIRKSCACIELQHTFSRNQGTGEIFAKARPVDSCDIDNYSESAGDYRGGGLSQELCPRASSRAFDHCAP